MEILIGIMVFIFGLVFGSFYNVVGYRLPNNMSIIFPGSHCPNCNHELKFYELIPVLSYIFQGGKCRKCKKKISVIYPFFELLTGTLFLLSYLVFGISIDFFICITFLSILVIITISDIKYYIIPDEVLIVGSVFLIIELCIKMYLNKLGWVNGLFLPILNGLASFSALYLIKILGDFLFKKESLGGGDIKLMFVMGLVLGFPMSMTLIFIASFIALPISIYTLFKKDTNVLPFGPYLALAGALIILLQIDFSMVLKLFLE